MLENPRLQYALSYGKCAISPVALSFQVNRTMKGTALALAVLFTLLQLKVVQSYVTQSLYSRRTSLVCRRSTRIFGVPPMSPFWANFNSKNTTASKGKSVTKKQPVKAEPAKVNRKLYPWETLNRGDKDSQRSKAAEKPKKPADKKDKR